jgi:uncharacterized protein involved in outer membrane biogenesis
MPMPTMPRFLKSPWTWAVTLAVVALYAAAGFLLVPRLVAGGVRDYFDGHDHRKVELGAVAFNPFTLELTIDRFAVPDADGGPLAGFDRLYVNLQLLSLLRGGADFKAIVLDGPRAHLVRRPDGRLNVMDLVPPPGPKAQPNAKPPRLWIQELAVRGGETSFVDQTGRTALNVTLKPIAFTLHEFSTRSEGNAYQLSARSTQDETLDWRGTFGLDPVIESQGTFKIGRLLARTIDEVGPGILPVDLSQGEINLNGSYEFAERGATLALKVRVAELTCTDVGLRAPGESDSWIQIPRLAVTGTTFDLVKASVEVEHVVVERPVVKAWRDRAGALNLARLVRTTPAASSGAPPAPPATPASAPAPSPAPAPQWTIKVPDIKVVAADVSFEDRSPARAATFHVAPLDATIGGFASPAAGPLAVDVDARVNGDGRVAAKGTLSLTPLAGSFAVDADSVGLVALQPYVDAATAMTIKGGTASAKGTLTVAAGGALTFQGDASVDRLHTIDNALEEDFINWRTLRVSGINAKTAPLFIKIRELSAQEPYARVIIGSNGRTNLSLVLKPNAPAPTVTGKTVAAEVRAADAQPTPDTAQPAAAAAPPRASRTSGAGGRPPPPPAPPAALPIEIGLVRIAKGTMDFSDFSIKPNVKTGIYNLAGTIRGLSGRPDARADVNIAGQVDRYAPVTITGKVNFLAAVTYTDIKMSFKNVELGVLSPYSGKFAGYLIDRGKLSIDLNYLIENRKLTADHRIIVNQLQLGEHVDSPDATHLPVKLAIALLKDRNGVIDLDLPVTGSLDDPQFKLGPIIWKVIVNLIEKAVTAPFALLGKLFGGGEEMSYIDFAAGSAELDATARGKLAGLVKALDSRPGLNVDLPLVTAPAIDAAALAEQKWQADLEARATHRLGARAAEPGAVARLLASPKDYRALLEDAYTEAFGHRAQIPPPEAAKGAPPPDATATAIGWLEGQLKPRMTVGAEPLDALAQGRASAVQAALLEGTGIDPSRVFTIKSAPLPASSGAVRMQLALH